MPTETEINAQLATVEIAKQLVNLVAELKTLNAKLDYISGRGQINVMKVP
jgi:hypothetical protein